METIETTTIPASALVAGENESNNYKAVRYNAIRHGILSKHVVLPHEDKDEFDDLLAALTLDHQPMGVTESHLVEELAGVIWRKRRVLLAEGAKINKGLRSTLHDIHSRPNTTVKNAVPGDLALVDSCVSPWDLLPMTPEELQAREQEAICEQEAIEKAIQILHRNGTNAYKDALSILPSDSQFWWQNLLDAERMEATNLDLSDFINEDLVSNNQGNLAQIRHCEAIKRQVIGEGIGIPIMQNLSRYETHLDRKFERTLAMLIKLKELRGKK